MDTETTALLFALLRAAVGGRPLTERERAAYNAEQLPQLISIAKKHDLAHLLTVGLKQSDLHGDTDNRLENETFKAIYRYERLNYELNRLCEYLEKAEIPFLPLKGAILRTYYPEPWMRTSCDIDILVHESDLERTIGCLSEHGCTLESRGSHDASCYAANGTHIELHYTLIEDDVNPAVANVLEQVWSHVTPHTQCKYRQDLSNEWFCFYHIAHMAKHVASGGCGIRPVLDLWILRQHISYKEAHLQNLLERSELSLFAQQMQQLSNVWFGETEHTAITQKIETYILCGGVYGTLNNRISLQQVKRGGKVRYILSRLWLPYDDLKFIYPSLNGKPILLPFYEMRRWCRLFSKESRKHATEELRYTKTIDEGDTAHMRLFLNEIGL